MLKQIIWCLCLVVLGDFLANVANAAVAGRAESSHVDTDINHAQNENVASVVNVVVPQPPTNCRRCVCTLTQECPNIPGIRCLSAASLCCCCAPRSFPCIGSDGILQPNADFMRSLTGSETRIDK